MSTTIYPYPNGTIWGFDGLISYVVSIEPSFFIWILAALWIIAAVLIYGSTGSSSRGWTFASLMCTILSFPLSMMGWMSSVPIYIFAVLTAVGMLWMRFSDSYY